MIRDYVALDLETSGLNPSENQIIEIGMAKVCDGEITETYSRLLNPKEKLSQRIVELTGITDEMVAGQPHVSEVIDEIVSFIGDMPLLGHNIIFDYSFLKKACVNHGIPFEKNGIDTLKLARKFLPEEQKKDLASLCEYFKIERVHAHRALDDVLETQQIFEQLQNLYAEKMPEAFQPYPLQYKVKKQSLATPQQMKYLKQFVDFHQIPMPELSEEVTRSEVSRLTDQLIARYGKIKKES